MQTISRTPFERAYIALSPEYRHLVNISISAALRQQGKEGLAQGVLSLFEGTPYDDRPAYLYRLGLKVKSLVAAEIVEGLLMMMDEEDRQRIMKPHVERELIRTNQYC